ncbi:MAG: hypothetical protein LBT10_08650 [Methanobrevibacter sp.]|jgi:hypothetical protein|nr:hypothetical protein [Methanobrevibacter sp.]
MKDKIIVMFLVAILTLSTCSASTYIISFRNGDIITNDWTGYNCMSNPSPIHNLSMNDSYYNAHVNNLCFGIPFKNNTDSLDIKYRFYRLENITTDPANETLKTADWELFTP